MTLSFTKMHGLGNDYVYVDARQTLPRDIPALARWISDRHTGVGGDGLVLISPSQQADVAMRIWNADGSEAEMCGNAIRCVARYAFERGLVSKNKLSVETKSGLKHVTLLTNPQGNIDSALVDMGIPLYLGEKMLWLDGKSHVFWQIDMGNPHAVFFVDDVHSTPVHELGPKIENNPCFISRTNVEFVHILSHRELDLRVWERGSGETMACGTGACASFYAAVQRGLVDHKVLVHLPGGDLHITLTDYGHVEMQGPAVWVFDGETEYEDQ